MEVSLYRNKMMEKAQKLQTFNLKNKKVLQATSTFMLLLFMQH